MKPCEAVSTTELFEKRQLLTYMIEDAQDAEDWLAVIKIMGQLMSLDNLIKDFV